MRTTILGIVLVSVSTSLAAAAAATTPHQCYYPDGSQSTHTACNATAAAAKGGFSACCSDSSYCMDNGLCSEAGILTRMSCTDKTFADKACPQYCNTQNMGVPYELTPCTATTFTCGLSPSNCSVPAAVFPVPDLKNIVLRAPQLVLALSAAGIPTTTIDPTATPTATIPVLTVTPTAHLLPANPALQFTLGQLIGVGAGVGLPLALAIAALVFLLLREKKVHKVAEIDEGGFRPANVLPPGSRDGNSWSAWSETTKLSNHHHHHGMASPASPLPLHHQHQPQHHAITTTARSPNGLSSLYVQELDGASASSASFTQHQQHQQHHQHRPLRSQPSSSVIKVG